MAKNFILIAILFIETGYLSTQSHVFFKAFDKDSLNNFGISIAETEQNDFVISGYSTGLFMTMQYYLLDNQGDSIWMKHIELAASVQRGSYIFQIDQSFIAIGSIFDTAALKMYVLYLKLSGSGQIEDVKQIEAGYRPFGVKAKQIDDYVIVTASSYSDSTHTGRSVVLLKIDTAGNKLWHKEYTFTTSIYSESVDVTPDNGFIIGGEWNNPATQSWDLFLMKTDSLGNLEWHKSYGLSNYERYGYAALTSDGGYAIAGLREINDFTVKGLLIKVDDHGDFVWEKVYGKAGQVHLFKYLKEDEQGNLILAGGGDKPNVGLVPVWLLKTDASGDTLWSRYFSYYGGNTHTYVEDLILTSDGGYAMTGYTLGPVPTRNDLWVMKTDHLGRTCDSPPCHAVLWDTGTAVLTLPAPARATLAPNPTTGQLTITLAEPFPREAVLTVYDVQGRTRRQWRLPTGQGQYTLHLGLPAGLYLVRLTHEGSVAWSGKVVVD